MGGADTTHGSQVGIWEDGVDREVWLVVLDELPCSLFALSFARPVHGPHSVGIADGRYSDYSCEYLRPTLGEDAKGLLRRRCPCGLYVRLVPHVPVNVKLFVGVWLGRGSGGAGEDKALNAWLFGSCLQCALCGLDRGRDDHVWVRRERQLAGGVGNGGAALHGLVQTSVRGEVGHLRKLKVALPVLLVKVLDKPGLLLRVADGAPHAVAGKEELVADVRAEEAIGSSH